MGSLSPITSDKTCKGLDLVIEGLNRVFDLQIPNPAWESPDPRSESDKPLGLRCRSRLNAVFFTGHSRISGILDDFEEEVRASTNQWVAKPRQDPGTLPCPSSLRGDFLRTDQYRSITGLERERRLQILFRLLNDEMYLIRGGSFPRQTIEPPRYPRNLANGPPRASNQHVISGATPSPARPKTKRRSSGDEEVFLTAPNSPSVFPRDNDGYPSSGNQVKFDDLKLDDSVLIALDTTTNHLTSHDAQRPG
jgi:hypothetical protein